MVNEKLNLAVGAAVLLLLLGAISGVLLLGDRPMVRVVRFKVRFPRVGQLRQGAAVKIANIEVGKVAGIHFAPRDKSKEVGTSKAALAGGKDTEVGDVLVSVWVKRDHARFVRVNSRFFVSSVSLIGARHLEIAPPKGELGRKIRPGDIVSGEPPAHLDRMLLMAYNNLKMSTQLMETIGPDLAAVRDKVAPLRAVLREYDAHRETLGRVYEAGRDLYQELRGLRRALRRGTDGGRCLTALKIHVERLWDRLTERIQRTKARGVRLQTLVERRRKELTGLQVAEKVRRVKQSVDRLVERFKHMRRDLKKVQVAVEKELGTVGALAKDRELFDDFKESQRAIKHTPWRVLGRPKKMSVKGAPQP